MREIIENILRLPSLTLPDDVLYHFKQLINKMEDTFSLASYRSIRSLYLKQTPDHPLITHQDYVSQSEHYIQAWEKIFSLFEELIHKIKVVAPRIKEDEFGADYNIPIFLNLISNHKITLMLLENKLMKASNIITFNKFGYIVVEILSAVQHKSLLKKDARIQSNSMFSKAEPKTSALKRHHSLSDITSLRQLSQENYLEDTSDPDKYEKVAMLVCEDMNHLDLYERFKLLEKSQQDAQHYIENEIISKLSTEMPKVYHEFYMLPHEELIQRVVNDLRGCEFVSNALHKLIEKFICIQDLGYTITANHKSLVYIFRQFTEKYAAHRDTLHQHVNKFNVNLRSVHSYYMLFKYTADLLPLENRETHFYHVADQVCKYFITLQPDQSPTAAAR